MKVTISEKHKDLFLKAFDNIKKESELELPDYLFIKQLALEFTNYVSSALNCVLKGVLKKTGLNPEHIKLASKLPFIPNLKGMEILMKGLYETLLPYMNDLSGILKTKIPAEKLNEPISIKGSWIINPETGTPLTYKQWEDISKSIVDYLGLTLDGLSEEFAVKSFLLAAIVKRMEETGIDNETIKNTSYEDIKQKFFNNKELPDSIKSYEKQYGNLNKYEKQAIQYSIDNTAKYLSLPHGEVTSKAVGMVRTQVTYAIQNKLSNQQLASNLYHASKKVKEINPDNQATFEAFTRDWRRIALTETSFAFNNGVISSATDTPDSPYLVYSGRYNPKEKPDKICNCFRGEIVKVITPDEAQKLGGIDIIAGDSFAERAVWVGKNRIGKKDGNEWIVAPSHPNCTHVWKRINPQTQVYDIETGAVTMKVEDKPELRKKIQESIATYKQSEEYRAFLQEQNRLTDAENQAKKEEYNRLMQIEQEKRERLLGKSFSLIKSKDLSKLTKKIIIDKNGYKKTVWVRLVLPVKKRDKKEIQENGISNFKKWFGDSKAVDANNDPEKNYPIKLYHASDAEIKEFDRNKLNTALLSSGIGFNFTPDKTYAENYGTKMHEVFLRVENPLEINEIDLNNMFAEFLEKEKIIPQYKAQFLKFVYKLYTDIKFSKEFFLAEGSFEKEYNELYIDFQSIIREKNDARLSYLIEKMGMQGDINEIKFFLSDNRTLLSNIAFTDKLKKNFASSLYKELFDMIFGSSKENYKERQNIYSQFTKHLQSKGYDGLKFLSYFDNRTKKGQEDWIVFEPNQIKSTEAKEFNNSSNNIYKSFDSKEV